MQMPKPGIAQNTSHLLQALPIAVNSWVGCTLRSQKATHGRALAPDYPVTQKIVQQHDHLITMVPDRILDSRQCVDRLGDVFVSGA